MAEDFKTATRGSLKVLQLSPLGGKTGRRIQGKVKYIQIIKGASGYPVIIMLGALSLSCAWDLLRNWREWLFLHGLFSEKDPVQTPWCDWAQGIATKQMTQEEIQNRLTLQDT